MVTQNHGKGFGGGFLTFSTASPSMRLTSVSPGWILSASSNFRLAVCQSSEKNARRPANQTELNFPCSLILTGVPFTKSLTAWEGMLELTAGPPELPHAAGASVWITGLLALSCLNPLTAPGLTEASTLADWFRSSWERTTPGKPRMRRGSPICTAVESASDSTG